MDIVVMPTIFISLAFRAVAIIKVTSNSLCRFCSFSKYMFVNNAAEVLSTGSSLW